MTQILSERLEKYGDSVPESFLMEDVYVPKRSDVAVIVGRFQVENLTSAQEKLINYAVSNHTRVIVFLGVIQSNPNRRNPMNFTTRRLMIAERFPTVDILPLMDKGNDAVWTRQLDQRIREIYKSQSVILYHGRDSFREHYLGRHSCQELRFAGEQDTAGTEARERLVNNGPRSSADYRAGVISAVSEQFPKVYPTVDIAPYLYSEARWHVALGRKPDARLWRFAGGFQDTTDDGLEVAAARELSEEMPSIQITLGKRMEYVTSRALNDFRYTGEDRISTTLFAIQIFDVRPIVAGDDLEEAKWFAVNEIKFDEIEPVHHTVLKDFIAWLKAKPV